MKRAWRYLAIGIAVYIPVLLATFPVERLSGAVERQVAGLAIRDVSGSLFAGQAGSLAYRGEEFGPVHWRFSPAGLLRGRLEYHLDLQNPAYQGQGRLGVALNGALVGHAFDLQLLPDRLINSFSPLAITSAGQLALQLDHFVLRNGQAQDVNGLLEWRAAELLSPLLLPLGDIECAIENSGQDLVARVIRGGALGASGDVVLTPDGRYTVRVLLAPGPEVAAETTNLLQTMMRRQPDGKFLVNSTGRL